MPPFNIISRIYTKRYQPKVPVSTSPIPPVEQRIHPDLNALAAELDIQDTPQSTLENNLPITPWFRNRRDSSAPGTSPVNPPSTWNTFGKRRSRRHNSIPHISDFGASPDVSLHSNHTINTSGSFSGLSSRSFHTPTATLSRHSHSPPSSGFTFGSVGPTYPALRFSLFGGKTVGDQDLSFQSLSQPRPSTSMPSLSQHQRLESISNESITSGAGPSRPRVSTYSSSDQFQNRRNRSQSSSTSRRRRSARTRRQTTCYSSAEPFIPAETRASNVEMSEALGTPFRLQQEPALGSSATKEISNIKSNNSARSDSQDQPKDSQSSSMATTPPRKHSPFPGGSSIKARGKGKERETSSRPSSPLRNATSPSVLAEFPVPSLPNSRPTTPRRSAMASSSKSVPSQPIPLATSTSTSSLGKGKRKADEVDGAADETPVPSPEAKKQPHKAAYRATFAVEPRTHRISTSSYATSHYARRKRARLSSGTSFTTNQTVSENGVVRVPSRTGSHRHTGTVTSSLRPSSRGSRTPTQPSLRGGSNSSHQQHSVRYAPQRVRGPSSTRSSRRYSVSQASIPISALISPHAPSISIHRSTAYHMRDPRKPSPVHPTPWSLTFPSAGPEQRGALAGCIDTLTCSWGVGSVWKRVFWKRRLSKEEDPESKGAEKLPVVDWMEGGGSPIHAFFFFLGFIFFPLWWIAGLFIGIPKTRRLGEGGAVEEKSVVLDDPQVEFDAKSWRNRCRVMAAVSLFTYVPFIALVVIFVPRSR